MQKTLLTTIFLGLFALVCQAFEPISYELIELESSLAPSDVKVLLIARNATCSPDSTKNDYVPNTSLEIFGSSRIYWPDTAMATDASPHITEICSMLAGKGSFTVAGNFIDYLTPLVRSEINICEYWDFLASNVVEQEFNDAPELINISFGTTIEDWWTKGAERLVEKYDIVAVASIGNGDDILGEYLYPAASPNFIGVGVASSEDFPSVNPEMLGKRESSSYSKELEVQKPDLVAPGNFLVSDINGNLVQSGNYSSFASPAVAAAAGILISDIKQTVDAEATKGMRSDLVRAILTDTAIKGAYWHKGQWTGTDDNKAVFDQRQGAGLVNLRNARERLFAGRGTVGYVSEAGWDCTSIDGTIENHYIIEPEKHRPYISATLVWKKFYKKQFPFEANNAKNTNLRLELWAKNTETGVENIVDYSDSDFSNVEHIFYPITEKYNQYQIVVVFSDTEDIDSSDKQVPYALSWGLSDMPVNWKGWLDVNSDDKLDFNDIGILVKSIENPRENYDINDDGNADMHDVIFAIEEIMKSFK